MQKKTLEKAATNIRTLVDDEETAAALIGCTSALVKGTIKSISANFGDGRSISLAVGNTGRIKIKYREMKQKTLEE